MKCLMSGVMAAVLAMGASAMDAPIVQNGTFDEVKDGITIGWKTASKKYTFRDGEGRSGTRALYYENDDPKFYWLPTQSIKVKPGKIYEFEVWVRTENLVGNECGATICIEWNDEKGKWLGGAYLKGVKGTHDWTRVKGLTARIPANVRSVRVAPYVRKGMTGKAWFDDVQVREYVMAPLSGLYSTAYRNLAADGSVAFKAALNLDSDVIADREVRFRYVDDAGKSHVVPAQQYDGTNATLTLPVAKLQRGTQKMKVEVASRAQGKNLGIAEMDFTRVDQLPERAVWVDQHGRTIVNGRPFFPLGMYWGRITTNDVDRYSQSAFNCLMPYQSPNDRSLLDYCHSKNLKVIYSVKDVFVGTRWAPAKVKTEADEVAFIKDRVSRFKDHPALLAWYLNDELPLTMLKRLTARRELMEQLDPGHPGWVVLYQYSQIRDYLSSFDIIGTDPYPIPKRPALMASIWTRATAAGTLGCKPLWQVPQAFNWGNYGKDPANKAKNRAPTENELRSMCWQCIANGANGLVLYSYFDLSKKCPGESFEQRWAECSRVAAEISRFIPVMLSCECQPTSDGEGAVATQLGCGGAAVSVRSWWKDGAAWVLVVNGGDESVTAQVKLNGDFKQLKCEYGGDGELKQGMLSVKLAPLGVSIFKLN